MLGWVYLVWFLSQYRWTIVKYFEAFLKNQFSNKCDPKQKSPSDWRCMLGGFQSSRPSINLQVEAYNRFISSDYAFSHIESPLKVTQVFVPNIHFISVVRHPIERVISSYVMMKEKACYDNCTLEAWMRRDCYLNGRVIKKLGNAAKVLSPLSPAHLPLGNLITIV